MLLDTADCIAEYAFHLKLRESKDKLLNLARGNYLSVVSFRSPILGALLKFFQQGLLACFQRCNLSLGFRQIGSILLLNLLQLPIVLRSEAFLQQGEKLVGFIYGRKFGQRQPRARILTCNSSRATL